TQTPASGPFELVTTPPMSVLPTSTFCAWDRVTYVSVRMEKRANIDRHRKTERNMGRPPWHHRRLGRRLLPNSNKGGGGRRADQWAMLVSQRNRRHLEMPVPPVWWYGQARRCGAGTGRSDG